MAALMLASIITQVSPKLVPVPAVMWLVVARSAIVALVLAWFWRDYTELRERAPRPLEWLLAIAVGVAVFLLWIYIESDELVTVRNTGFNPHQPGGEMDWGMALSRWVGFALVVPVMEELFWRSFLLRWICNHAFLSVAPRQVGVRAFLITAVLFGLEHDRWAAGAVAGMLYNALYMRTGNLWVPIVAHAVTNGVLGIWILYTHNWSFW